jgi:hypothetical protein
MPQGRKRIDTGTDLRVFRPHTFKLSPPGSFGDAPEWDTPSAASLAIYAAAPSRGDFRPFWGWIGEG